VASAGVHATFPSYWTRSQCDQAIQRGPHPSASRQFAPFLLADMYDYVQMGYWVVLPYTAVRHYKHLRIAPAGVVPQRERRPRPIMDYTFYGTNQDGYDNAPHAAMQFGTALQRILQRLVYCNPAHGPPLLAKIDLADGYYRVPLSPATALNLAVVIPNDAPPPSAPLVAIPLTLPMGWAQSPPFFCAFTETVTDLVNATLQEPHADHTLLACTQALPLPQETTFHPTAIIFPRHTEPPLAYTDIYIDDFMVVAQRPRHLNTMNALLHNIHRVFHDHPNTPRRPVISASKLEKGDAAFSTQKRLLGWDIDTHHMTLSLPQHRLAHLQSTLTALLDKKRTSKRNWKRLLGMLRSTTPALYGAKHLFSILQDALIAHPGPRIRLTHLVKVILRDWLHLATTASHHPVPIHTVVPQPPTCIAATDASRLGLGGFWITPNENVLWRVPLPHSIQQQLVTTENCTGVFSNSDFELAALITGSVLPARQQQGHTTILIASDNTPAVAWTSKGSTTSTAPNAFLLHHLAQQRRLWQFDMLPCFTPGVSNQIADCCSRLFHLSDTDFLTYMNLHYPAQPCWTLAPERHNIVSVLNSILSRNLQPLASLLPDKTLSAPRGTFGKPSVPNSTVTPTWQTLMIQSPCCKSLHTDTASVPWLPVGLRSALERWKAPFVPWDRRSPHWAATTPALRPTAN
jgi:hypothetical protein